LPFALCLGTASGCAWDGWSLVGAAPPPAPPGPVDSVVLRAGGRLEQDVETSPELAGGQELLRRNEYAKAAKVFHHIAENKKNSEAVGEEARYYEAECLRCQGKYPRAVDTYHKQLIDFPSGAHREQAVKRMFDIANYWLDDTRTAMRLEREKQEGKRAFVMPGSFVHWERSKPLLDEQGRALEALEEVNVNDMTSPVAAEALFLAGTVKFYNQDYREADRLFSQIVEMHQNCKFAAQAAELAIISKHMSTGGSDYDGRKTAEARLMVHTVQDQYPELANQKGDFLQRQLAGINKQQAEKDLKTAEFYRRTGHPGSAYFCYEIVRRRYPGTPFFDKATERMHELKAKMDKKKTKVVVPPIAPPPKAETAPMPRPRSQPAALPPIQDTAPMPRPVTGGNP
jgi:outer membrane protein assembly factor BamD (BamD/ComL family)